MAQLTLLDIAKINAGDKVVGLVEENLQYAPEMAVVPARTIDGRTYEITARTSFPGVGFRNANEGIAYTKSTFINRTFQTYILSGNLKVDVAVAASSDDGPEALKAIEASGVMKQSLLDIGSQFYYGLSSDAKGFRGLLALHDAFSLELVAAGIPVVMVDAGGTTANTGSSVYAVNFSRTNGVNFLFGGGLPFAMGEWFKQMVNDGTTGQDYLAWVNSLNAFVGLQAHTPYCIGRLKDSTAAEASANVTDAKIGQLISTFPIGYKPDMLFMNRRSALQLQTSRSATSITNSGQKQTNGQDVWAMEPSSSNGIPITVTDSITSTEALS